MEISVASEPFKVSAMSKASLEKLRTLFPEIAEHSVYDLIAVAFDAAVINKMNKNDDGITSDTVIRAKGKIIHKPLNVEHWSKDIVGHITSEGYTDIETHEFLEEKAVAEKKNPFYWSLGGIVYKKVNEGFYKNLLLSLDKDTEYYKSISASWEVGFSEYRIAWTFDPNERDISKMTVVSDPEEIAQLEEHLRCNWGSGKTPDGKRVYRLIVGDIVPLGIGFVGFPAADVGGVYADPPPVKHDDEEEKEDEEEDMDEETSKIKELVSHLTNLNVKSNNHNQIMDELLEKIKTAVAQIVSDKLPQEAVASLTAEFAEAIKVKNEEFRKELEVEKQKQDALLAEKQQILNDIASLKAELASNNEKLQKYEKEAARLAAEAVYNTRMEAINSEFDLDQEDLSVISKDVKELDSEEGFASYKQKLETLMRHKKKGANKPEEIEAKIAEEINRRLAVAGVAETLPEDVINALKMAKPEETLPNNNQSTAQEPKSLVEKYAKAFSLEEVISKK